VVVSNRHKLTVDERVSNVGNQIEQSHEARLPLAASGRTQRSSDRRQAGIAAELRARSEVQIDTHAVACQDVRFLPT
jgi:hypothetical protein